MTNMTDMPEFERTSHGNILKPIHEQPQNFMDEVGINTMRMLIHLSNQIYEMHQSVYGWPNDGLIEGATPSTPSKSPEPPSQ